MQLMMCMFEITHKQCVHSSLLSCPIVGTRHKSQSQGNFDIVSLYK